ncbi:MAG: heavy metal-associated domain-containing protein [Bacteroidota bacterium]
MNSKRVEILIGGMSCASCAEKLEKALLKLPGVVEANVNFVTEKATVEFTPEVVTETALIETVNKLGYEAKEVYHLVLRRSGSRFSLCTEFLNTTLLIGR